ncbi:LacI family DNA-binding transcriptional regulator [Anoxynatronum sibiricum]|uniref:LacI family DNA-binding transcriptional regulator n=1 Tax=Anoxynatronum sibiricum TaxID=210623 RepID=A0ABU9VRV4_9CLOT
MASIRDIAKSTGLSISTISRYINSSGYVSKDSAELIQKVIDEMDYVPNRNAQAIFNKKSGSIGLVIPSLVNPFFSEMATIIGNKIQDDGYGCVLCFTEDIPEKEEDALDLLKGYRVDGIIVARGRSVDKIQKLSIPVISFESIIADEIITVSADNYQGGRMAFEHLYEEGSRKMIHIKGPKGFIAPEERCKGFLDASADKDVAVEVLELSTDYLLEEDLDKALNQVDFRMYDGLFVFNDINCIHVISYLRRQGLSIPGDLQVIGFDNSYLSEMNLPRLTTIEQSPQEIAQVSYHCLKDLMDGTCRSTANRIIPVKLIKRDTTGSTHG